MNHFSSALHGSMTNPRRVIAYLSLGGIFDIRLRWKSGLILLVIINPTLIVMPVKWVKRTIMCRNVG